MSFYGGHLDHWYIQNTLKIYRTRATQLSLPESGRRLPLWELGSCLTSRQQQGPCFFQAPNPHLVPSSESFPKSEVVLSSDIAHSYICHRKVLFEYSARGFTRPLKVRRHVNLSINISSQPVMGSPCNISGSASQIFFKNKGCAEYRALSIIAESLAHPQRTLLSAFVQHAIDLEVASQYFLDEVSGRDKGAVSEFLGDWICLLKKGTSLLT